MNILIILALLLPSSSLLRKSTRACASALARPAWQDGWQARTQTASALAALATLATPRLGWYARLAARLPRQDESRRDASLTPSTGVFCSWACSQACRRRGAKTKARLGALLCGAVLRLTGGVRCAVCHCGHDRVVERELSSKWWSAPGAWSRRHPAV
eukprot:COSAG05_NODE_544_length_8777_cov_13.472805_6_plen_158_part_00